MSASASPRLHFAKPQKGKRIRVRPIKKRKQPSAKRKALMAEDRPCERCATVLVRKRGERPSEFERRRFCSRVCSLVHRNRLRARVPTPKICQQCGVTFQKRWNNTRDKFCSAACYRLSAALQKAARIAALKCCICGGSVTNKAQKFSYGGTCSTACGHKLRHLRAKTRKPSNCEHCQKPFIAIRGAWRKGRWARFCSDVCRRAVLSLRPQMLPVQCTQCGKSFKRTAGAVKRVKRVFCGKECQHAFFVGENTPMFRGDKDPNRGADWNRLAETIRVRDGHRCKRCEITQDENKQKLSVDHVRPWRTFKDKSLANHPDNLVSLCRKCHSHKTTTVERDWLRGDVIAWKRWVASLKLPSAKFGWVA